MDSVGNLKFKKALTRQEQTTPPVWMMRQAGRYHKHYQSLRANHSFVDLCKKPKLAAEVALGPIQDFDLDVAILFSDILFVLDSMGFGLEYTDKGPKLSFQLDSGSFSKLKEGNPEDLSFQSEGLKQTRSLLPSSKSLIGFVGGPWTLFGYSVEGSHQGGLKRAKANIDLFRKFCDRLMPLLTSNIQSQLDSGAEIVMVFDTASGELDPFSFHEYVVPTLQLLKKSFPERIGYYSKGTLSNHLSHPCFKEGWAGLGFDHRWNLTDCFRNYAPGFVQGNFDQAFLTCEPPIFERFFDAWAEPIRKLDPKDRIGWVAGLGHGVIPQAREENVKKFVELVRERF